MRKDWPLIEWPVSVSGAGGYLDASSMTWNRLMIVLAKPVQKA